MTSVDRASGAVSMQAAIGALGRQFAVCVGALVALAALLVHVPVSTASVRGAATTLALVGLTRVGEWLCERTATSKRRADEGAGADPTPENDR